MTPLERLGLAVKRLQDQNHRTMDARLAALGVSLVQWHALREIDRHAGSSQLRLAELTFNSAQSFGTLVTRMEKAELITRNAGAGRAFALHLTPKGKRLLEEGRRTATTFLDETFGTLSEEEQATLQRLLDKVLTSGGTDGREPG